MKHTNELLDKNIEQSINQDQKMSFNEYKIQATIEDIKKLEKRIIPFWWENIPLLGCIIYLQRLKINQKDIDRGILMKQLTKYVLIFLFAFLILPFVIFQLLTPWFTWWVYSFAIKKTKEKLAINDI